MGAFLDQVLFNAAAAALLAPIAYASRWCRRPALTHALWLVVLLRLVAPPIYSVRVDVGTPAPPRESMTVADIEESPLIDAATLALIQDALDNASTFESEPVELAPAPPLAIPWLGMALALWVAVGGITLLTGGLRWLGFQRSLATAELAGDDIQFLVGRLSRRLQLRHAPLVVQLPGQFSPCVIAGLFGPRLVLPAGWLDGLTRLQRAAVLVHELAHLKRRDHWVRWLEAVVTVLYWWHPVVWVARRELREAEELCCDGWVVATLPAARRTYADALIDTLDFLASAQPAVPTLASGFGQVRELRRRLHMILKTRPTYRSGKAGAVAALGLGLLLPISMARSQDGPPEAPQPPTPPKSERRDDDRDAERRAQRRAEEAKARDAEARDARRAAEETTAAFVRRAAAGQDEVAKLRAELQEARAQLERAQAVVNKLQAAMQAQAAVQGKGDAQGGDRLEMRFKELGAKLKELRAQHGDDNQDVQRVQHQLEEMKKAMAARSGGGNGSGGGKGVGGGDRRPGGDPQPRRNDNEGIGRALMELRHREAELKQKFGDQHPEVVALHRAIERVSQIAEGKDNPAVRGEGRGDATPRSENRRPDVPGAGGGRGEGMRGGAGMQPPVPPRPELPGPGGPPPGNSPRARGEGAGPGGPPPGNVPRGRGEGTGAGGEGRRPDGAQNRPGIDPRGADRRVEDLEKQLKELRKMIENMQRDRERDRDRKPESSR